MFEEITRWRFRAYFVLFIFSIILLGITAGRIAYTTNLPPGDPVNGGVDFIDPVVVLLLVTSIFSTAASGWLWHVIYRARESKWATRVLFELIVMGVIWFLLVVGTALATNVWPNLSFCTQFTACQVLQAMLAFAWLSTLLLSAVLGYTLFYCIRWRTWSIHVHGWEDAPPPGMRSNNGSIRGRDISRPQMYSTQFDNYEAKNDPERNIAYPEEVYDDARSGQSGSDRSRDRDRFTVDAHDNRI